MGKISSFYNQFDQILHAISNADKIVLRGDFNSEIGQSHYKWPKVVSSDERLSTQMAIGNYPYALQTRWSLLTPKKPLLHPKSKRENIIDYINT